MIHKSSLCPVKMNLLYILIAIIVVAVVVIFIIYHTTGSAPLHTVVYDGTTIYSGNTIPPVSSDGSTNVLIGTGSGLILYNIDTKVKTIINPSIATGLAYDETTQQFMELESDGTFSSVTLNIDANGNASAVKLEIGTGYTLLYDTTDGYLVTIAGVTSVTGTSGTMARANGAYGMIQLKIS